MFRGLTAFNKETKAFAKDVPRGGVTAIRKVSRSWFEDIVVKSPRDTGFFSSMWKWVRNRRPSGGSIRHPSPGHGRFPRASTPAFTTLKADDHVFIYNNVAYGKRLEAGYSRKAPANFVTNATRRARNRLRSEFKRLKWRSGQNYGLTR